MVETSTGSVGWRFSPKDEELINYFLARKINGKEEDVKVIREIDVCKWEPWDLPGQSILKSDDKEWFFFCHRDRKFPSSSRLNRATQKGFWKATGKDRKIRSKKNEIGFKKTLVYHTGRASKSRRTYWVMHEYRTTLKELDGTHPDQRPFVLCRLFKKDDEFVPDANDNDVKLATPSPILNEQSTTDLIPELLSNLADPSAGQDGELKLTSADDGKDASFMTPSKDTFSGTERHIQNYPADALDLEDITKSTPVDASMQPQQDENFDYLDFFADLDPDDASLSDSPLLESLGSSLPCHSYANNLNENEALQLNCDKDGLDDYTNDVLQSLLANYLDNPCKNQGDNQISTVDYGTPTNDQMTHSEIPCLGNGSYLKTNTEEAELLEYVEDLDEYAFNSGSEKLSQANNLQEFGSTWTSFQELDQSQTRDDYQGDAFSGGSILEHCVFSDEAPSSCANLCMPDRVADRGVQIRHREFQSSSAKSNFDKHGTAQRRIHLQIDPGRKLVSYENEQQHISDIEDEKDESTRMVGCYTLQSLVEPPQLRASYKLVLVLASVATIFIVYAAICGCLLGWQFLLSDQEPHFEP